MSPDDLLGRLKRVRRSGNGYTALCPAHNDRTPSLSIRQGASCRILLHCFGGCPSAAILEALALDKREASNRHNYSVDSRRMLTDATRAKQNREIAEHIWRRQTRPAAGTVVEDYLRSRGIMIPIPPAIRFHPQLKHPSGPFVRAAMIAGVQSTDGGFAAIHRTFLDGAKKTALTPAKAALGPIAGGAVRLSSQLDSTIALAEGIETGLSILQATRIPTWTTLGTSNLAKIELPAGIHEVIICADHDTNGAGEQAALAAAAKLIREGRKVRIAHPPVVGADFNDLLQS